MRHMRKLLALVLAVMMVMSLATSAFAGTIKNDTDREYDAYQIFSGTQAAGGKVLGDIEWGNGINKDAFLNALISSAEAAFQKDGANIFAECATAAQVAKVLADNTQAASAFANLAAKHLGTSAGTVAANETKELEAGYYLLVDKTAVDETNNAANPALLQVTNEDTMNITAKYDTPEVEKKIVEGDQKLDETDANIGDTITFELTATMPEKLEGYDTYKIVFHDTMSKGLAYVKVESVTIDGVDKTSAFTVDTAVNDETGETTLTVSCNDVLAQGAKEKSAIVVTYTAVLDDDAVIGANGNPNKVYLEYSNNPNWNGKPEEEPTGKTPEDEVKVFTWEIPAVKVDGADNTKKLAGAEFSLYTDEDCTKVVNLVASEEANIYKVCTQADCEDHTHITKITTDTTGAFEIEGLKPGTYYLKEEKAPAGYNILTAPITVVIGENGTITAGDTTADVVTVENNAGATLPETGGIGTTIFYALGGILVLAAVVLLVTKKRMSV